MENGSIAAAQTRPEETMQQQETDTAREQHSVTVAPVTAGVYDAKAQKMSRFVELAKKKIADLQAVVAARNATIDSQETTLNQLNSQMAQVSQQLNDRDDQVKALKDLATRAHAKINDLQEQLEQAVPAATNGEESVRGRPTAVVHRVEHAGVTWCLALLEPQANVNRSYDVNLGSYDSSDGEPHHEEQHQQQVEWMLENELFQRVESTELPFTLPSPDLSQKEADELRFTKKVAVDDLVKLQDAYRRYRVRADVSRKQKESEIARLEHRMLNLQQNHIVTGDEQNEMAALRKQVQTLSKQVQTMERKANDATAKLRVSQAASEQWQAKCEELVSSSSITDDSFSMGIGGRERGLSQSSLLTDGMSTSMLSASLASNNNSNNNSNNSKLQREYDNYRQRALRLIDDRDRELAELRSAVQGGMGTSSNSNPKSKAALTAGGAGEGRGGDGERRTSVTSHDSGSSSNDMNNRRPAAAAGDGQLDLPYLKCLLLKYMASPNQNETREHMEAAIATVLRFSPDEIKSVHENRSSFFSSAFSIWG